MNPTNVKIQLYKNAKDNIGEPCTLQHAIEVISSNKLFPFINNIRIHNKNLIEYKAKAAAETDPELQAEFQKRVKETESNVGELKKNLPAVTWSGTFTKRAKASLNEYSGLICIDIDKLEAAVLDELKAFLKEDKYTWLVFVSPSGNGLKVIVRVAGGAEMHTTNFLALEQYYRKTYSIDIDPSGKDVSRLCFLSMDNDFRCNYNSQVFTAEDSQAPVPGPAPDVQPAPSVKPLTKKEQQQFTDGTDSLEWVKQFTDNKLIYQDGNRNNYVFLFACNANRKGFDISDTLNFCSGFASDLDIKELSETIRKAYEYNQAEHAKYKRRTITKTTPRKNDERKNATNNTGNSADNNSAGNSGIVLPEGSDYTVFWKEHIIEKGKGEKKYEVKQLQLLRVAFMQFLTERGFFIIETGREGYQICQYRDGVVRTVDPRKIKNDVYQWCKDQGDRELFTTVEEMLRKGQKNYFSYGDLESIPVQYPDFLKDTANEAFFFFQNCYVRITAEEITTHQISDVQRAIWDTSIIKKDFTYQPINVLSFINESGYFDVEKVAGDMMKFITQVATNPERYNEVDASVVIDRFQSICSSIGFMLHGYKHPIGKAVLAVDHKIPADKTEQNGGTGKSLVGKSFKYLKGVTELDGRDFDDKYPFRFESIDIDTKIVVMSDCRYNLDFGSFFVPITSDFRYNRRHTGYITIPYEDSAKWWFDSNFVFKGEGSSFRRRQHIIEFDDFYHDGYSPVDYFNHLLFTDWSPEEWNRFYNFYFQCVQLHLEKGLISYPQSNYDNRKLMVESNQDFIDWMDATDHLNKYKIERNKWLSKKELLKLWNDEAKSLNMPTISPHSFSKWVKKYCTTKGFVFYSKKTNGTEYYMVANKEFKNAADTPVTQELFSQP